MGGKGTRTGVLWSLISSVLFGVTYFLAGLLRDENALEVTGWRILATSGFLIVAVAVLRGWSDLRRLAVRLRRSRRLVAVLLVTSLLVGVQLWLFVWAPSNGQAMAVSVGYFLLPLVMVLAGRVFFDERLTGLRLAAVVAAGGGLVADALLGGGIGWPTLVVAIGYSTYFTVHRLVRFDTLAAFLIEMLVLAPASVVAVAWGEALEPLGDKPAAVVAGVAGVAVVGAAAMSAYIRSSGLLPTGLFGMLGYVQPVLLVIATTVAGAALRPSDLIVYGPIVGSLALLVIDQLHCRKEHQ